MNGSVGIGELRQNLSRYLRRVKGGERLVVTERNRPVASIVPLPEREDALERLIAEGRATRPASGRIAFKPVRLADRRAASKALEYVRGE